VKRSTLHEQAVARHKFFAKLTRLGFTPAQIAKKFSMTRQRVSQLIIKAIEEGEVVVLNKTKTTEKHYKGVKNVVLVHKSPIPKAPVYRECAQCGKKFTHENLNRKTCSSDCFKKLKRSGGKWSRHEFKELQCNYCGKTFKRSNYLDSITRTAKYKHNDYCNTACYLEKIKKDANEKQK